MKIDKTHICFFSHSSLLGGAERCLLDLMKLCVSRGIRCSTVMEGEGALKKECLKYGIEVKSTYINSWWAAISENNLNQTSMHFSDFLQREINDIIDFVKGQNTNIIYTQTIVNPIGAIVAEKMNIPHIWGLREYGEKDHGLKFIFDFKESMAKMFATSDHILSVTTDVAKVILGTNFNSDNLSINYSYIELPKIYQKQKTSFFTNKIIHIGIFGNLVESKNQKDAISACIALLKSGYNIKLYMVGRQDKAYLKSLSELITHSGYIKNFVFMDFIENPYEMMNRMDIILSCSISEAMGRTLFEAVLLKKPIIYSNKGGPTEIFTDSLHGLTYTLYKSSDLANKIAKTINNPIETKKRVETAYIYILETFNQQKYFQPLLNAIEKIKEKRVKREKQYVTEFVMEQVQQKLYNLIVDLKQELQTKGQQIQEKEIELQERVQQLQEKESKLQKKELQLQQKEQEIKQFKIIIDNLEKHKYLLLEKLESAYNSKRWKLFYPIDRVRDLKLSKKLYVFIKSNKKLRDLYHKLPLSNEKRWKIRQFINTGKFQKTGSVSSLQDRLDLLKKYSHCSKMPFVSIIIPCYNQGCYLWDSVSSALMSYSGSIEVIVVNDGSTNKNTLQCLQEIQMFFPEVKVFNKTNGGLSSARNFGIEKSKGEYIQFLDADDILAPGKIDAQICMAINKNSIIVSNYLTCDENCKNFFKTEETIKGFKYTLDNFLFKWERGLSIPIHCSLFPQKIFDTIKFDTDLSAKEDWVFWISLLQRGFQIDYVDVHSSVYRVHDTSMVRHSFIAMSKQWEKAYKKIADMYEGEEREVFVQESEKWLDKYYRSNPNYKEELQSQKAVAKSEITKKNIVIDKQEINNLIKSFYRFGDNKPVISIIVPIYNHYKYLQQCLESVTKQGDVPIELICVNDNSSDIRVNELLLKIQDIPHITVLKHNENRGISYTQNEAVKVAKGKYIAFLDCDDYLKSGALEYIYTKIKNNPHIDYFFTDRTNIDGNNQILYDAVYKTVQSSNGIKSDLLDRMIASHLKIIKKSTYMKIGGSDKKMSGVQDWDLALKIAEIGNFKYIEGSFYFHRLHKHSVTTSNSVAQYKKTNLLRREYTKQWLHRNENNIYYKKIRDIVKLHQIDTLFAFDNVAVFSPSNIQLNTWYCPEGLKKAFKKNKFCIMDARGFLDQSMIEFIQDFNSYFDLIICDRLSVSSQIIGTLWSEKIICVL